MGAPQTPINPLSEHDPTAPIDSETRPIFGVPPSETNSRHGVLLWVAIAVLVLILVTVGIFIRSRHEAPSAIPNTQLAADPYAANLAFTQLAMSQSTSLSGGTSTFLDGHVRNNGPSTVTGITMQVIFRNEVNLAPQVETLPLNLIRTHEPYIDTEPVSAAPLKPGDESEFRLVFETVASNWNQQMPELIAVRVARK
jgi:hypothetical protein